MRNVAASKPTNASLKWNYVATIWYNQKHDKQIKTHQKGSMTSHHEMHSPLLLCGKVANTCSLSSNVLFGNLKTWPCITQHFFECNTTWRCVIAKGNLWHQTHKELFPQPYSYLKKNTLPSLITGSTYFASFTPTKTATGICFDMHFT